MKKVLSLLLALSLVFGVIYSTGAFTVTASDDVKAEDSYGIQIVNNDNSPKSEEMPMTYNEETGRYELDIHFDGNQIVEFYVVKNHEITYGEPSKDNIPYLFEAKNYTNDVAISFDPVTEDVRVTGDTVPPMSYLDVDSVIVYGNGNGTSYLHGSYYNTFDTSNAMTEVEPGVWEITMQDVGISYNHEIAFAVNSVNSHGNASAMRMLHMGSEVSLRYPTGKPIKANCDGRVCLFVVEEEASTVTVRLDLRNFSYRTKEGAEFTINVVPTHPVHIPADAVKENVVPATCTTGGSYESVIYCSKCGEEISRTHVDTEAKGHTSSGVLIRENEVAADCEHNGSFDLVDYCKICNEEIERQTNNIRSLGHCKRYVAKSPATEDSNGVEAHYECIRCEKLFDKNNSNKEVTAESLVIPQLQPTTEPTTEEPSTEEPTTEPGPNETLTINTVSNVFTAATKAYSDTDFDEINNTVTVTYYADLTGLRIQTAQFAIEYDPNFLRFNQDNNGVYDSDSGNFDYSQMFPVTRGTGYVNYVKEGRLKFAFANKKGFSLKQDGKLVPIAKVVFTVINSSGSTDVNNNFEVLSFLEDSTSNEYVVCSNSGGLDQDNYDYVTSLSTGEYGALFSVIDHIEVIDEGYAATCTEDGLTDGSHCAICGDVIKAQEIIPSKGHVIAYDRRVSATCTESGLTSGRHCSVCNEIIVAQEVIPATGHTSVTDRAIAPTCTKPGVTEGSHCSVCGDVIEAQQLIPATGHTSVSDPAIAPTCTETGYTEGSHCSKCNIVLTERQIIPATGHLNIVVDPAVPSTCSQHGLTEGSHCSDCGEVFVAQQTLPKEYHTYAIDPRIPETCTEDGLSEGVHCSICGEIIVPQRIIQATHLYITDYALDPTCTKTGLTEGSHCRRCGDVLVAQQIIPALGHQDTYDVPGYAATYSSTGLTDGVFCRTCNNWAVPQEVIPKLVPSHPIGDLTGDDKIDVLDALDIQKYAAEEITLNEEEFYIADVNNDGYVDVLDSILIQKYAAELINTFPKSN